MKEQQWRRVASSRRRKNDIALVRRQLALHSRIERALASRKDARARARMLLHALSCVCAPLMYALYKFDFHEETRWFVVARNLGCAVRTGREHRATTGRILFSYRRRRLVVLLASGFTSARGWHARKFDSYSISFNVLERFDDFSMMGSTYLACETTPTRVANTVHSESFCKISKIGFSDAFGVVTSVKAIGEGNIGWERSLTPLNS